MDRIDDVRKEDVVNHPNHYNQYDVEVITLTRELNYDVGNVVKYVVRAPFKKGIEDLQKAVWYARDCIKVAPKFYEQPADSVNFHLVDYFTECATQSSNVCAPLFASLLQACAMYDLNCRTMQEREKQITRILKLVDLIELDEQYRRKVKEYNESKGISR